MHDTIADFRRSAAFVVLLVGMLAVQPLSTDFYLPTLPSLTRAFAASPATVTWTLSALVATFGVTQLFIGPLADRYGRKPVVTFGYAVYCAASVAALGVPSMAGLIVCRMLQGLGMACAFVVARALIRDLYAPQDGARVMARGFTGMSVIALVGPFASGLLDARFGWHAAFVVLALYSGAMALGCMLKLPETNLQRNPQATRLAPLLANYRHILRDREFLGYTAATLFSYGGLFAFISGSSFVFIGVFGLSRPVYGLAFGFIVLGYLCGTVLCRRALARAGMRGTLALGGAISVASGGVMAVLVLAGVWQPWAILLPQFGFMVAHGIVQPTGQAGCVGPFPQMAGAASALNGFAQMAMATAVGAWMGASFNGTPLPLALSVFVASCGVAAACAALARHLRPAVAA